jgi:hypothetical protein
MGGQAQKAARALAAGRAVVGVSLCVAPDLAAQWAGEDARTPGARLIIRALGARDAALALGTLASAHEPTELRRWLIASSACDVADFVATLGGPRSPARSLVLAMAAAATAAGLAAAAAV